MKEIMFEVSALEESTSDLVSHYEINFTEPISASWLTQIIKKALEEESKVLPYYTRCKIAGRHSQE